MRLEIELYWWVEVEAILLEPTDVYEKITEIVFESIQPVAKLNQIQPPDELLNLRHVTVIPIHALRQRNLGDFFGFANLPEVIDHGNAVGIVDAFHGIHSPPTSAFRSIASFFLPYSC